MDVAGTLAWLDRLNLADLPALEHKARLLLLDTVACAVAGFAEPELVAMVDRLAVPGGAGPVRWPGMQHGLAAADAALVAATAICWHEACEGLASAHGRPGLHALPIALSLGVARGASLGEVLDAVIVGYELGGRFGEAMRIRPGMHVDGSWGSLAAAAAAARVLGLGSPLILTAMAIAACQIPASLYLPIRAGRTARNLYAGHAATMGAAYAHAAAAGITAPETAFLEAARSIAGDPARRRFPWAGAGRFLLLESYLKPFAAVRHVHYPVACAIRWRAAGGDVASIESVIIETYDEALTYCGNRAPVTAIQAQFSLSYGTAYALRFGDLGPAAYRGWMLADPAQCALEARVQLCVDPAIAGRGARLRVRAGGVDSVTEIGSVPGDPDQPMGEAAVLAKALRFMGPSIGAGRAAAIATDILHGPLDAPLSFLS